MADFGYTNCFWAEEQVSARRQLRRRHRQYFLDGRFVDNALFGLKLEELYTSLDESG